MWGRIRPEGFNAANAWSVSASKRHGNLVGNDMIRKLKSGYRLYSRKLDPKTRKRRNLGTFASLAAAKKHEREIQYFKRH